ncbi:hypothetical protein IEO21_09428 [Rhodonia placenta]|uniref:Spindle pole body component n=1 Tax=Rhodonia placenta TaxID=104341 RepID=A0A8H7TYG8_9APHY|nr:hypothetical protein IEO21_09428 [Postia placenta]
MRHFLSPLPSLDAYTREERTLPDVRSAFFIPRLADKPQNPIMDTLNLSAPSHKQIETPQHETTALTDAESSIWEQLAMQEPPQSQNDEVFASVRYIVRPPARDPNVHLVYVAPGTLLECLSSTLAGVSSYLHIWDPGSETFVLRDTPNGVTGTIILTGTDEVVSRSLVERFLVIGATSRRLENFVGGFASSVDRVSPVVHSFMHALSTVLLEIRQLILRACSPPYSETVSDSQTPVSLTAFWLKFADVEEILRSLSSLCHREMNALPINYTHWPNSASDVLSKVYYFLTDHLETQSSRIVTATFAYILTVSSEDYFLQTCLSVGYNPNSSVASRLPLAQDIELVDSAPDIFREENPDILDDAMDDRNQDSEGIPAFMSEIADALPLARRSLKLLHDADPRHPFFTSRQHYPTIAWIWTTDDVMSAWTGRSLPTPPTPITSVVSSSSENDTKRRSYKDELKNLAVFDLDPGTYLTPSAAYSEAAHLRMFLDRFPSSLPSLTPTMPHLVDLVLSPLVLHINNLSEALLSIFLSPSSHLNLRLHLGVLRSYLLLTSHAFKSRLEAALFSDSAEQTLPSCINVLAGRGRTAATKRSLQADAKTSDTWAVGVTPFVLPNLALTVSRLLAIDPPKPLDVVLNPVVLSKYHRIFAFNLRLMRVTNVVAALFRMTRKTDRPLFPTLTHSNRLVLHFGFVAQSFLASLSSYVYDKAIRGRFDALLDALSSREKESSAAQVEPGFLDIFALAKVHAQVLDNILSACLLRSGQKAVGDVLRNCIELILELGILAGERYRGRMEEYQAAGPLEDLWARFSSRMATLMNRMDYYPNPPKHKE